MSQVALYHCDTVDQIPLRLQAIVESLGAERVSALFQGKKVLLKPNVCIDHPPEKGATTHPAVLDAVISLAKDLDASTIIVGDGPAVGVKGPIFERTGIKTVCEQHGVELRDFNREQGRRVQLDDALALKEATIAQTYFEVDTVVNLPVFKTNMLFWISGALKNMKGLLVGMEKHKPHYLGVPQCVADLNRMVRQDLIIMDGFVGMMGDGPAAGPPANARLLIGGFDPVAADAVVARLMGFNPAKIPMIHLAEEVGVGSSQREVIGDPITSFKLRLEKPTVAKNGFIGALLDLGGRFFFRKMGGASRNGRRCGKVHPLRPVPDDVPVRRHHNCGQDGSGERKQVRVLPLLHGGVQGGSHLSEGPHGSQGRVPTRIVLLLTIAETIICIKRKVSIKI